MIAAIVLAAGSSKRFGADKLLQPLGEKTILRHAVEAVLASKVEAVHVVTGHESNCVKAELADLPVAFVDNPYFSTGLSSSLTFGVKSLPGACEAALIFLGDMPFLRPQTINQLVDSYAPERAICVPVYHGRRGHPVLWARRFFAEMAALEGDQGAKALMALHHDLVYELEVDDEAIHIDIDTPDDLSRYS